MTHVEPTHYAWCPGCYDARVRVLVKYMSLLLRVDWDQMDAFEDLVIDSLQEEEHHITESVLM